MGSSGCGDPSITMMVPKKKLCLSAPRGGRFVCGGASGPSRGPSRRSRFRVTLPAGACESFWLAQKKKEQLCSPHPRGGRFCFGGALGPSRRRRSRFRGTLPAGTPRAPPPHPPSDRSPRPAASRHPYSYRAALCYASHYSGITSIIGLWCLNPPKTVFPVRAPALRGPPPSVRRPRAPPAAPPPRATACQRRRGRGRDAEKRVRWGGSGSLSGRVTRQRLLRRGRRPLAAETNLRCWKLFFCQTNKTPPPPPEVSGPD